MNKIRIGITQRELKLSNQKETYDSLDQNWFELANKCDIDLVLIPNRIINISDFIKKNKIKGFIFSGGGPITKNLGLNKKKNNNTNAFRDITETKIFKICKERKIPILGVCRGMQSLNILFKGGITKIPGFVNKINYLKSFKSIYKNKYKVEKSIMSFHDYSITKNLLSKNLIPIYYSGRSIQMLKSKNEKILGIMWHPERGQLKKTNITIIKKFFNS